MAAEPPLEVQIESLLADPAHAGHPMREALAALLDRYQDQLSQLERLTSISDHYHSALRERNQSLSERYRKQIRHLQKIVRISDHYQKLLQELNEKLTVASTQDPLTGLANRRLLMERLTAEVSMVQRGRPTFSLAAIDIDHFKSINDTFGHDVGDAVLVTISRTLAGQLRQYDVCARWGGEEFMVFMPETAGPSSQTIAERLRALVQALPHSQLTDGREVSVSIGVAEHHADARLEDTIKRADSALYKAKRAGRNRVVLSR